SAPQFTWFFGADFTPSENLIFSAQARRVGASFSDDDNIPTNRVEGYTVADISIRYTWDAIELYGFIENITDEFYLANVQQNINIGQLAFVGAPRVIGGGIRMTF
ncbi:MAG: hypothetical protein AAGJ37_15495, partial [Pseudomonadota bacterium]